MINKTNAVHGVRCTEEEEKTAMPLITNKHAQLKGTARIHLPVSQLPHWESQQET